jgi:hypothetical protein
MSKSACTDAGQAIHKLTVFRVSLDIDIAHGYPECYAKTGFHR